MMICHPYLVTKRMTRFAPLLQEKAHYALSETNKTRFPASTEQENWLVSRLRKGREKTRHSFFESAFIKSFEINYLSQGQPH